MPDAIDETSLGLGSKAVWEFYRSGWNQRDLGAAVRYCSDRCVLHHRDGDLLVLSPEASAVRERWIKTFPDFRFELLDAVEQGDKVALRLAFTGTQSGPLLGYHPSHRMVKVTQMVVARIDAGRVADLWEEYDELGMFRQLGLKMTT